MIRLSLLHSNNIFTIFFTPIIYLEVIVHFKHTHTHVHKRQNAASRCDSSVAFSLKQFELFQTTCDRPEAVQFIPDCSVVFKIGLKKLSDRAVYKIIVKEIFKMIN